MAPLAHGPVSNHDGLLAGQILVDVEIVDLQFRAGAQLAAAGAVARTRWVIYWSLDQDLP